MITKILPNKIPLFWEAIKFGASKVDDIEEGFKMQYFNVLLHDLMNGRVQCFVRDDSEGKAKSIFLTKIISNKVTKRKELLIQSYYSFSMHSKDEWLDTMDFVKKFGLKERCSRMVFDSRNPKLIQHAEMVGFKEHCRQYHFNLRSSE